jgi:acyl-CoA synthetase (AMP-forming)/AMP-acid ligase II
MLLRHPDIQQVAVLGVPDTRLGEVGMAFVVLWPGATITGPEIVEWSRSEMANYKVPRRVEVLGELPLNATGKVMKDELRARTLT